VSFIRSLAVVIFLVCAPLAQAQLATVTVTPTSPGVQVPPNFGGISTFNVQDNCDLMGTAASKNLIYTQLIKNLIFRRQSFDLTSEDDDGAAGGVAFTNGGGATTPNGPSVAQVGCPGHLYSDLNSAGFPFAYHSGVPLCAGSQTLANNFATNFITSMPAGWPPSMVVGNEPDGPCGISYATYNSRFGTWTAGIRTLTGGGSTLFMGPQFGGQQPWVDTSADLNSFVNSNNAVLYAAGQHWYALAGSNGCGGSPTIAALLAPTAAKPTDANYPTYVANAHSKGSKFRISEMNSIDCSGNAGISDTFASTLWVMDAAFNLANVGTDGINIFSDEGDNYDLFGFNSTTFPLSCTFNVTTGCFIRPEYYGLMIFQEMTQGLAQIAPCGITTSSNVTCWWSIDDTNTVRVLVINKDQSGTGTVNITLPGYGVGKLKTLTCATGVTCKTGVSYAGQTFDGSTTGVITGASSPTTVTPSSSVYSFSMAVASAALLTLTPTHSSLVSTPGWHKVPSTALCGGGSEANASFGEPNNFPANLGSFTPYGFGFGNACREILEDSNSGILDTVRHRMIVWGGGHNGYLGNDLFSAELPQLGTANPVMYHLNYPANPTTCPASGPASTQVTESDGTICKFNSGGALVSIVAMPVCSYTAGCFSTNLTPGPAHTYASIVAIPPPYDEMLLMGGAGSAPSGFFMPTAWLLSLSSVTSACAISNNIAGCNPQWTPLGGAAGAAFYTNNLGNVGTVADWDPNAKGVWVQNQNGLGFFNPATNAYTVKSTNVMGFHFNGAIDPLDQYFIFVGQAAEGGIRYESVATGSTFTINTPTTVGCANVTNGSNFPAQYPGVVWDPISKAIRIFQNGGNVQYLLDPKTWTCTTETYGSVQGTDYPQPTVIDPGNGDEGTFGHFRYNPSTDTFVLWNDPFNDIWTLRPNRATDLICNGTWSNGLCTGGSPRTNTPVTMQKWLRQGDFPSGTCLLAYQDSSGASTSVTTQTDVKNRWPDGSLKIAMASFIIPSMAAAQVVRDNYAPQVCPSTGGYLTSASLLGAGYNLDGQMQLTGSVTPTPPSARTILTAANSGSGCKTPAGDMEGDLVAGNLCEYWLKGPIVTGVLLTDGSTARSFDVNTDGNPGGALSPLHPIFETWCYPQTSQCQMGYTLENAWASTTATKSARDQTFSLVLTAGNTSPITLTGTWGAGSQILSTRSVFHRTYCMTTGAVNTCSPVTIDQDWPYLSQTKFTPNWDPAIKMSPSYVANFTTAFNNSLTWKGITVSAPAGNTTCTPPTSGTPSACNGLGFYPGPNACGDSNTSTTGDQCFNGGFNASGAAYFHGPLTTWEIVCLLTFDPGVCGTVTIGNHDLAYQIPYFYREADSLAGHGQWLDAGNSNSASPTVGTVGTFGRIVSVNARTQLNMQDATFQSGCGTLYSADWVNYGGAGQDAGVFYGFTNSSHWANGLGFISYLLTGQYAYYEEQVMQAAFSVGLAGDYSPNSSRSCYQTTSNQSLRMGAAGYWEADQERGNDWQGLTNARGCFLALDGSPEKAYLCDKLSMNLAVWEGVRNIPCDIVGTGKTYPYCGGSGIGTAQSAWSYGRLSRLLNPNQGGGGLGSWVKGVPSTSPPPLGDYAQNYPICANTTGGGGASQCPTVIDTNVAQFANSNFQNAYSAVTIGQFNDWGFCPQVSGGFISSGSGCQLQGYGLNHFVNTALNPQSNPFHLQDYVYVTGDLSGNPVTSWPQAESLYFAQPTSFNITNPGTGFDESYVAENASAMSYFTSLNDTFSGNSYSGQTAYNVVYNGAIAPIIASFNVCGAFSPKWCIAPRTIVSSGLPPLLVANQPVCVPGSGSYTSAQAVTCTDSSSGAIMCYTTNGAVPATNGSSGCSSGTLYTSAITISVTSLLQVIAGGTGFTDGSVASYNYAIGFGLLIKGSVTLSGNVVIK
jgi:chitobiase/beta-hexosaminidase-like protein